MTNQQKAKARFVKRYGMIGEFLVRKAWLGWLGVYLAGWTDAQKQSCQICGEPIPTTTVNTCRKCHFGEEKDESHG